MECSQCRNTMPPLYPDICMFVEAKLWSGSHNVLFSFGGMKLMHSFSAHSRGRRQFQTSWLLFSSQSDTVA